MVVDSDQLTHRELEDPVVIDTYRSWWGDRVIAPDGRIDRNAVADTIFSDEAQRLRLQSFLYPRLARRRREIVAQCQDDSSVVAIVFSSPLLYEAGLDQECDVVVFVDADRALRLQRAAKDRGWTEQEFQRRENLQKPLDIKKKAADHIMVNNSSTRALRSQVEILFERLIAWHALDRGCSSREH